MPALVGHNKNQPKGHFKPEGLLARLWSKIALCGMLLAFVSGCASYGIVQNKPRNDADTAVP